VRPHWQFVSLSLSLSVYVWRARRVWDCVRRSLCGQEAARFFLARSLPQIRQQEKQMRRNASMATHKNPTGGLRALTSPASSVSQLGSQPAARLGTPQQARRRLGGNSSQPACLSFSLSLSLCLPGQASSKTLTRRSLTTARGKCAIRRQTQSQQGELSRGHTTSAIANILPLHLKLTRRRCRQCFAAGTLCKTTSTSLVRICVSACVALCLGAPACQLASLPDCLSAFNDATPTSISTNTLQQ